MYQVKLNVAKNAMYITLKGRLTEDEVKTAAEAGRYIQSAA